MLQSVRVLSLILAMATAGASLAAARTQTTPAGAWQRTDTQHFQIHYLPAVARDVDRVVRSAERAYTLLSERLNFYFVPRTPLVMFALPGPITVEEAGAYAGSEQVAPREPHRNRIAIPLLERDDQLDAVMVHELTHALTAEIVNPGKGGGGGVPRWVREGIANYMVGAWSDDNERLMRELLGSGGVPALSQLAGDGGFSNPRVNDAIGQVAFDYIESRWGPASIRPYLDALIVPRVNKTYDAVFGLTPAEFDIQFRQYVERRFGQVVR